MAEVEDLLTRSEVIALLRGRGRAIVASTWSSYVAREQAPPPVKHVGRTPLWKRGEVEQWAASPGRGHRTDLT